jgi:hypothetical protein
MDKVELRKKDFVTSLILIAFGLFMIVYSITSIPMKDSWGGVMNVWYVSPGLFPVCIGGLIILMGIVLCRRAIQDGGARRFMEELFHRKREPSDKTLRFLGILLVIVAYVYLYIPRIDYFLSTLLTLAVFITLFYLDRPDLLKKLFKVYLFGCLLFFVIFLARIDRPLTEGFSYAMDLLVFLFLLVYLAYCRILIQGDEKLERKWRLSIWMSIIPSLVLIPSFKYLLLVPLPVEGGAIELMNLLRYAFRS